ncbi:MAG: HD-GYP domain-containing protein [Bryobacterales bacterium]|nr:HD-GYP domain-containing protein [Bryobacterales bacterium]
MSPNPAQKESKQASAKTTPLARLIFLRVALPLGILFLSSFTVIDRIVQGQLRDHIKQELRTLDHQSNQDRLVADERLGRSLEALTVELGTAKMVRHASQSPAPSALAAVSSHLQRIGASLDEDLLSVSGPDREPIVTLRREDKELVVANHAAPVTKSRTLASVDGTYYFTTSHPLLAEGKPVGWLTRGRHWVREVPLTQGLYLVADRGRVAESAGRSAQTVLANGATLPSCPRETIVCEVELDGRTHLLMRSAASAKDSQAEILSIRSVDLMASPLLGLTRGIMLAGALLSIFGAIGMTLLTERAISRPLKDITDSCVRAHDSGDPLAIRVPQCRIHEVNALGQTLQTAVRSIEDGQTRLTQAYFQFMGAIVALLDARDTYTAGHSHRVSAYSEALARAFGLPQQQIDDIRIGALLHDIGKIGVPDEVLRKHERLTKEEFDMMKQHPTIGRKVLEQIVQFEKYLDAVELHHENLDGTGYPRGLRGEQIPISARIVKVADVYDALSTDRPYRKRMPPEKVHAILRDGSGSQFDRLLVEIFLTRCVPGFDRAVGLEQLHRAIGEVQGSATGQKSVGA